MTGLRLRVFGIPSLRYPDGSPALNASAAKDLALLTYLTLEPGSHTREEVAALFWGDSPDLQARASLRQALKRLKAVAGDALQLTRQTLNLVEPPLCDALEFQAAAPREPVVAAGFEVPRFFTGMSLRHAPGFEEWLDGTRLRLLRQYHQVLSSLSRDAMTRWCWRESADWAERWLASDPLSDEACRILMEALYLAGDPGTALARAREYEARLTREVAGPPSAALVELKRRIESDPGVEPRRPISEEWLARGPQLESGMVGRSEEWASVMDAWRAVSRGRAKVILLEGEAGVGKTRLAEEFLRWALAEGAVVLRGRGYDPTMGTPYGPLVEALRCGLSAPGLAGTDPEWLTEATRLLPELRRRFPTLAEPAPATDPAGRGRLFESVAQIVLALATEAPVVMLIDDVQWCDGETCSLLHFLARRWSAAPIALVTTLTLGELERDAPAARLCRALRVQAHATTVTLAPLNEDQVWTMIHEMGHIRSPEAGRRFARRVFEVTSGNPFYVIELLKTLFAQGLLAVEEPTRMWRAGPEVNFDSSRPWPMPQTVQDAIAERVARLPPDLRDLLATAVLAGPACETDLLSHVHGISRLHVAALCEELVGRRLLVEAAGVYRSAHSLISDVVHGEITASRRREIHRCIALALEAMAEGVSRQDLAGRIARHAEHGGEGRMACRYALEASIAALGRYAPDEALSWLDLAAVTAVGPEQSNEVNRLTAEVLELAGRTSAPHGARRKSVTSTGLAQADLDFS